MKTFYFLVLINFGLFANAQYLKVNYSIERNSKISDTKFLSAEMKAKVIKSEQNIEKYELFVGNGNSFFTMVPEKAIVNEGQAIVKGNTTFSTVEVVKKNPVKFFKSNGDDKYYIYNIIDGYEFYNYEKLTNYAINYKQETTIIENYVCKLVELTNKNHEITKIWYTEDVPVSAGPFGFNSFPGLVLKIEAPTFVLYATEVSNKAKESDMETIDKELHVFSGEAYINKVKELNEKRNATTEKVIKL